jgi:hypothetical protein
MLCRVSLRNALALLASIIRRDGDEAERALHGAVSGKGGQGNLKRLKWKLPRPMDEKRLKA